MSSGSSGVLQKTVDRAGFFRWGAQTVRRLGRDIISRKIDDIKETFDQVQWSRVADMKTIGSKPRLYFVRNKPVLLVSNKAEGLTAFSASCPEEGGLLEWRERAGSFCCPFCQSAFDKEGKSGSISMSRHEIQVIDDQVFIRL